MPGPEVASLYQTAVMWPNKNVPDTFGQLQAGDPIELRVRWTDVLSESLDPTGQTIMTDASVVVNQDVVIGSLMWLGRLRDWNPAIGQDIKEVKTFKKSPDIKGRVFKRTVGLMRYKGTLPPAVPTTLDSPEFPWNL